MPTFRFVFVLSALALAAQAEEITFNRDIAPIVFERCASCHRPGEAAPFSLLSYEDVAKRGRLIAAVTSSRLMPPWKADTSTHEFRGDRRLTEEQITAIQRWVDDGMAEGDAADLPDAPVFTAGWQLGEPDLVVEMPEGYTVYAEGRDIYRGFVIPIALAEDKWIRAIEIRPTARPVVHHVLFYADATGAARRADEADPEPGYSGSMGSALRSNSIGGWAVGNQPQFLPDGLGIPFPKGSDLVLQYHFHPTGKEEFEKTVLGLYFAGEPPQRTIVPVQLPPFFGALSRVNIPAGEAAYRRSSEFVLPVDVEGISIGAHAHYIGKTMKMTATLPDGSVETLLSIGDWDFAWQDDYYFQSFPRLPRGTKLRAEVTWDNSAENPRNPSSPPVRVRWGEQSTDEMGSVTLNVLPVRERDLPALRRAIQAHIAQTFLTGGGQ